MIRESQCIYCKHFQGATSQGNPQGNPFATPKICAAFPQGIPQEVLLTIHDHRLPFDGDHGVRYEPTSEEEDFYSQNSKNF